MNEKVTERDMSQQLTGTEEGVVNILLQKIERLEDAAKRGIGLTEDAMEVGIPTEKVISQRQCEWTLQNCAMFRHWVNEIGIVGLRQSPDDR